jgi:hypothetical protein
LLFDPEGGIDIFYRYIGLWASPSLTELHNFTIRAVVFILIIVRNSESSNGKFKIKLRYASFITDAQNATESRIDIILRGLTVD